MNSHSHNLGVVSGAPNLVLRAEGALVLIAAISGYSQTQTGWLLFAALFFTPDIFMLGYLANNRIGAIGYNLGHTYLTPAVLWLAGWLLSEPLISGIALIWIGHIGFDRAVGYGLKYAVGFKTSHLGTPFLNPTSTG